MKTPKNRSTPARILRQPLRVAKHLYNLPDETLELQRHARELQELFLTLNHTVHGMAEEQQKLHAEDSDIRHRLEIIDQRLSDVVHQLTIMNEQRQGGTPGSSKANNFKNDDVTSDLVADDHLLDNFYVEFEHWFRGTDAEIKQRQTVYLPYFTESKIDSQKYPVVDIGCGRGEFVQLLKEHGVRGIGLDLNKAMVEHARKQGVEAEQGDALTYLRKQKTNSLMAITGFHIVEHIPFVDLVRIFDECYRTLQPGGFVIFETPNPENIIVGTCNFWSDPSHLHPLPPAFLDFALKTRGFTKTEVKRLHPIKADIASKDPLVQEMAERIYGPQDYAVIATK